MTGEIMMDIHQFEKYKAMIGTATRILEYIKENVIPREDSIESFDTIMLSRSEVTDGLRLILKMEIIQRDDIKLNGNINTDKLFYAMKKELLMPLPTRISAIEDVNGNYTLEVILYERG